jgi:hypothetical protein
LNPARSVTPGATPLVQALAVTPGALNGLPSDGSLARAWAAGAACFDQGAWWDAHEHWEQVWRADGLEPEYRASIRACIQLAAALHKPVQARDAAAPLDVQRGLVTGMERLLQRAIAGFDATRLPELTAWFEQWALETERRRRAWAADVQGGG